jgi:hypothetical protein
MKNLQHWFGAVAIAASFAAASLAATQPAAAATKTCFRGYHLDANGHCHSNHPIPSRRYCPPGYYAHVAPSGHGYRCKNYP